MTAYLSPLLFFQRFFIPALLMLLVWGVWRTVFHKDMGVGLALYLGLVIIVDGFLNTGIFLPGVDKGSIRYSEVCAFFLLINRPPVGAPAPPYRAVRFLVGLYFFLLFVSAFRSDSVMPALMDFRTRIVPQIIAFVIAIRGLRSTEDYRRFVLSLMALSLIIGLFVFWDLFFDRWLLQSDMLFKGEYGVNRKHGRFGSFFLNPNYLGAFTVLVFPVAFVTALKEKTRWLRVFAWMALLSLPFCLVETQSRGPLLAFGMALSLLLFGPAGDVSRTRRVAVFLPLVVIFVLVMPGFLTHAFERFDQIDEEMSVDYARTRQSTWRYVQRIIADNPLGVGFGEQQFIKVMAEYGFEQEYGEASLDNPHNSYLQMTVYAGFPALIAFILANVVLVGRATRSVPRRFMGVQTPIAFGLAVGLAGFLASIYPDMHMFTQTVAPVYWVFFGLLLSLVTRTVRTEAI